MKRIVPAILIVLIYCLPAFGWNSVGHEVIAQIAYDKLTPDERAKVVAVLKGHPRYDKDLLSGKSPDDDADRLAFLQCAAWPDIVRSLSNPMSHSENHPLWHYIDFPYCLDGKTEPAPVEKWDGKSDPANLIQAYEKITTELKDPATPADRKAIDVCWVMHLVGDIHQPLHAVSLFSNTYPAGDKGGNLILFNTGLKPDANLHAIWDNLEGATGRDYRADPVVVRKVADRLEAQYPVDKFADALKVQPMHDWAMESYELAKSTVYLNGKINGANKDDGPPLANIPPLPTGYEDAAKKVADSQSALAGYRLTAVLRDLIK